MSAPTRHPPTAAVAALAALLCAVVPAVAQVVAPDTLTTRHVQVAVRRGVANLKALQQDNGAWAGSRSEGLTALCTLALLNAGAGADDPAVARALDFLLELPNERTYETSLKCQALAAADPKKYAAEIRAAAAWLARAQLPSGMWTYGDRRGGRGDNSNTQFALLGLHEAARAGVPVPEKVWRAAYLHLAGAQFEDGGWGYTYKGRGESYGSMTAAGLASLHVVGQRLHAGGPKVFRNGVYPGCGKYLGNRLMIRGANWLARRFTVRANPGRGGQWLHYYLYGLERVGMISGLRSFGDNDWYRQGAAMLVNTQEFDGRWGRATHQTAFALLFLAKGNRPVLFGKLQWNGRWNRNIHDLENLTTFIDDKFGKPVTWQAVSLELSLVELRAAPVLLITGHEFPELTDAGRAKLRAYVESGGTLLAEACCGWDDFEAGFRAFAAETFSEYRLRPLPSDHPVFGSFHEIDDTYSLEGIDVGCRTGVFFSPNALSALWELKDIPELSDLAFRLGTNIAAYATGREKLPDRLDEVTLPDRAGERRGEAEIPRGAVRIARLFHKGDYNADPHALVNLAAELRKRADVDVVARTRHLRATDGKLFEYPVVFMTGHYSFEMSDEEVEALRLYLTRGGVLIADACCGRAAFDKSFRELMGRVFADNELTRIAADHPIFSGKVGERIESLRYRKVLADQLGEASTTRPDVEAVVIDGRTAVLYSRYDFSCALEGDNPYSSRGYVDADGQALAVNMVLYAIGY